MHSHVSISSVRIQLFRVQAPSEVLENLSDTDVQQNFADYFFSDSVSHDISMQL